MKMQSFKTLAAKTAIACALTVAIGGLAPPAHAGIPVIDAGNLTQNIVSALENVAQYTQLITSYETQLQQYENMLTNTAALPTQTWSQVQGTISGLTNAMQGLNAMTNSAGSLSSYLGKFGDTTTYSSQPCFNGSGCTQAQLDAIAADNATGNAGIKASLDSQLQALKQQQDSLTVDAQNVQTLQSSATSASGQKAAMDAANQLAGASANQLVQIRALLVAAQTAQAAALEQQNATHAQQAAADQSFLSGSFTPSPGQAW